MANHGVSPHNLSSASTVRVRSRIERLGEALYNRSRISCASMPQAWSARQLQALQDIVLHGRSGGIAGLARRLGVTPQGAAYLLAPLYEAKLVERTEVQRPNGPPLVGLIVTKKGAEVVARVENAEIAIEDCVLQNLSAAERDELVRLLEKAVTVKEEVAAE